MNENLKFSPRLKNAMEEIKEILTKHDLGAFIILHSPGHCEHYTKLNTNYSALEIIPNNGVKMKGMDNDMFNGDVNKHECAVRDSLNMLKMFADVGGMQILPIMKLSEHMDKHYGAKHDKGNYTGHDEIFN